MKSGAKGSAWIASASIPEKQKSSVWGRKSSAGGAASGGAPVTASTPEELTKVIEDLQNALTAGDQGAFSTETISVQVWWWWRRRCVCIIYLCAVVHRQSGNVSMHGQVCCESLRAKPGVGVFCPVEWLGGGAHVEDGCMVRILSFRNSRARV